MVFPELCSVMALLTTIQAHGRSLDLVSTSELLASEILGSKRSFSACLSLAFPHFHSLAFLVLLCPTSIYVHILISLPPLPGSTLLHIQSRPHGHVLLHDLYARLPGQS